MKESIKSALTKNIGLKVLALVFSFLLWLVVVNIDDPKQTRTFTAVVTVMNDDVLTDAGKLYEIKDGVNTVSFRVTAKRSIIEKLSSADFSAVADMKYLEDGERVPVTITAKTYSSYITISSKQNYLYVVLEDQVTERFIIEAKTSGEPESGLAINSISCSPNVITVTGPAEVVASIEKVTATCDIDGVNADITESVMPRFYDSNGEAIDSTAINMSVSTVDVSVDFVNLKSVDIQVKTSGTLDSSLTLDSITTDLTSVMIKGQPNVLNEVTAIVIPDSVINLSELTGSMSTTVDITAYLPEGVSLVDSSNSTVTIYVNMDGEQSKQVNVPIKNIRYAEMADGQTVQLIQETITVNIFGTETVLSGISEADITGYIDCSGLTDGEQNAILHFDEVDGVTIQNTTVLVDVSGTATEETTETTEETTETTDTSTN